MSLVMYDAVTTGHGPWRVGAIYIDAPYNQQAFWEGDLNDGGRWMNPLMRPPRLVSPS